jgi:hypothetical protein
MIMFSDLNDDLVFERDKLHAQCDELLAVIAEMHERICTDSLRIAMLARGNVWHEGYERGYAEGERAGGE